MSLVTNIRYINVFYSQILTASSYQTGLCTSLSQHGTISRRFKLRHVFTMTSFSIDALLKYSQKTQSQSVLQVRRAINTFKCRDVLSQVIQANFNH